MIGSKFPYSDLLLLLSSLCIQAQAQAQTSVTAVIQLAPAPASLEATVITRYKTEEAGFGSVGVVTYSVACPTAASPENDACRSLGIYPAQIWHTDGPYWGGVITTTAESRTETWVCTLHDCSTCPADRDATCRRTIVSAGSTVTSETTMTDGCAVERSRIPLVITAGVEKLQSYSWKGMPTDVAGYTSGWDEFFSSAGCPARQTLKPNTAIATPSGGSFTLTSSSGTMTSNPSTRQSVTGTISSPTARQNTTSTSTGPASTSSTGGGSHVVVGSGVLVTFALMALQL